MRTAFVGACLALASAGVVASAALHGCSSTGSGEPVPLMGRWEMVQTVDGAVAGVTTMVFEGSGALRLEVAATSSGLRNGGQWSANSGNLTLTFDRCETLDAAGTATVATCQAPNVAATYEISNATLTLMTPVPGTGQSVTTVFQRK